MPEFVNLAPDIYRLRVPFSGTWTGVVLVRGTQNVLIDSAASASDVDNYIVPALKKLGMSLSDIHYLACTHCHGDHVGGHARIRELCPSILMVCSTASQDKLADPLKYSRLIRATFPAYSPEAPASLRGVTADALLDEGGTLAGYLRLVTTPGHDTDTVCWLDERSGTLITGDSLQLNGTVTQGIALVMDLPGYLATLKKLKQLPIRRIVAGHDYLPLGSLAEGPDAVVAYIDTCASCMDEYAAFLREAWDSGEHDPAGLARGLIAKVGGVMPDFLFLPLYTVTQFLENMHVKGEFK